MLVIDIIVEPQKFPEGLLADLLQLAKDQRSSSLDVVVMPSSNAKRRLLKKDLVSFSPAVSLATGVEEFCIFFKQWRNKL